MPEFYDILQKTFGIIKAIKVDTSIDFCEIASQYPRRSFGFPNETVSLNVKFWFNKQL